MAKKRCVGGDSENAQENPERQLRSLSTASLSRLLLGSVGLEAEEREPGSKVGETPPAPNGA